MASYLDTARGSARATFVLPLGRRKPLALAVLLHGAGTDTSRSPLPELADLLAAAGVAAVRFDQPGRVAGRNAPDPAHILDASLRDALPTMRLAARRGAPLFLIGRSSGARVGCRIAAEGGVRAVVALGFPWQPPRRAADCPLARRDRDRELRAAAAAVPVLVLQGERDPFGVPPPGPNVFVELFAGVAHTPTVQMAARAAAWVTGVLGQDLEARTPPPGIGAVPNVF